MTVSSPIEEQRKKAVASGLWAIRQGFSVFAVYGTDDAGNCLCEGRIPGCTPGKHPVPSNGFKAATTDPAMFKTQMAAPGATNYGMVPREGVVSLDLDGDDWRERIVKVQNDAGAVFPPTLTTSTPSGGEHLFYDWTPGVPLPAGHLFGFVARRHDDGYVVGPGSRIGPKVYGSNKAPIAVLPKAIAEQAKPLIKISAGTRQPEDIEVGGRYDFLRDRARQLVGIGLSGQELFDAVWALNQRLTQPKTKDDVERAIGRAEELFSMDPPKTYTNGHAKEAPQTDFKAEPFVKRVSDFEQELLAHPPQMRKEITSVPDNPFLIEGLMRRRQVIVFAATEGVGKSMARLEIAMRLATRKGKVFGVFPVNEAALVGLLDAEHDDEEEFRREEEMLDALGMTRDLLVAYWRVQEENIWLDSDEGKAMLAAYVKVMQPDVLFLDTIGMMFAGEEHGPVVRSTMRYLKSLAREHDCTLVLIHHLTKAATDQHGQRNLDRTISDVRGQFGQQADAVWLMSQTKDYGKVVFATLKRNGNSRALIGHAEGGLWKFLDVQQQSPAIAKADRKTQVLRAIAEGRTGESEVVAHLSSRKVQTSVSSVNRDVAALREAGLVQTIKGLWTITDEGAEHLDNLPVPGEIILDLSPERESQFESQPDESESHAQSHLNLT